MNLPIHVESLSEEEEDRRIKKLNTNHHSIEVMCSKSWPSLSNISFNEQASSSKPLTGQADEHVPKMPNQSKEGMNSSWISKVRSPIDDKHKFVYVKKFNIKSFEVKKPLDGACMILKIISDNGFHRWEHTSIGYFLDHSLPYLQVKLS